MKNMRLAPLVPVTIVAFLIGGAIGAYAFSKLSAPAQCPSDDQAAVSAQNVPNVPNVTNPGSQPAVPVSQLLRGTVVSITGNSLTVSAANPDPAKAKEKITTTVTISPKTAITRRTNLSPSAIDALMKKQAQDSINHGGIPSSVPLVTYTEEKASLSDIKPGTEADIFLALDDKGKTTNEAVQISVVSNGTR